MEDDPAVATRGIIKMKRLITSYCSEIKFIRNKGSAAVSILSERNVFRGMFMTLDNLFEKLLNKWDEAIEYCEIHKIDPPFPKAEDQVLLDETKQYYYEAQGFHLQVLSKINETPPRQSLNATAQSITNHSNTYLPKINIKVFKGEESEWLRFKELFTTTIIDEPSLSNAQRFHFLLSFLQGPAYDSIKHIPVVDVNFTQAWEYLLKTYDNKRELARNHIDRLLTYRCSSGKPTAESLQLYLSNVSETVTSLENLEVQNFSQYLLCELALRCLDSETREAFELSITGTTFPTFTTLRDFVQNRRHALKMAQDQNSKPKSASVSEKSKFIKTPNRYPTKSHTNALLAQSSNSPQGGTCQSLDTTQDANQHNDLTCPACRGKHTILRCPDFVNATPLQRVNMLKSWKGCRNCLYPFHRTSECSSLFSCKKCSSRHNTLLHLEPRSPPQAPQQSISSHGSFNQSGTSNAKIAATTSELNAYSNTDTTFVGASTAPSIRGVLLGTIKAKLINSKGQACEFRGVLDPGSQVSFLTTACSKILGKSTRPYHGSIIGVDSAHLKNIQGRINVSFQTRSLNLLQTEAVVVPIITPPLPQTSLKSEMWEDYLSYDLSDPDFVTSSPISFLIGADLYPEVITGTPLIIHEGGPGLIDTVFGFTVIGRYVCDTSTPSLSLLSISDTARIIEKFWEIEEPSTLPLPMSPDDRECENHFATTHYRTNNGRYVVFLPFKPQPSCIKPNTTKAIQRFYALENKFLKNEKLRVEYSKFMKEYLDLGHMSLATCESSYVIPHHPVFKIEPNGKPKIRVVFDGSFRTSSGSLNEHMHSGPKLQNDICNIVLNFRRHTYVLTCDIVKMYRQIVVAPEHRKFQHIVWRFDPKEPLSFYQLDTLTYGLRSSPFLAIRCLQQLAKDEGKRFPNAAEVLVHNSYVDDCTMGADCLDQLMKLKTEFIQLLAKGGFELSKWNANHPDLLEGTLVPQSPKELCEDDCTTTKILGMKWDPKSDVFLYEVSPAPPGSTKRMILSVIARLFDPLGYLSPVIFFAKCILQETWKSGINWDDPVPKSTEDQWTQFVAELPHLSKITIPRAITKSHESYQVVGFCDASERGYCAVVYLRSTVGTKSSLTLLKSKTRLAPLKVLTIPRLELCAMLLLSQVLQSLLPFRNHLEVSQIFCFSDSTIALAWLKTEPHRLNTFVSHRVQQLLDTTQVNWWYHIKGVENPADVGSRGLFPSSLKTHSLWWHGPQWCQLPIEKWPSSQEINSVEIPELKPEKSIALSTVKKEQEFIDFTQRFSSINKLIRSFAYVRRFINNARIPKRKRQKRKVGPVSTTEFRDAKLCCIRLVQHFFHPEAFYQDHNQLSPELRRLAVFTDHTGLLRVGGRLSNAPLPLDHKHPILLPARSHFSSLIVMDLHIENNHAGPSSLLAFIRHQYWIPRARNLIRFLKSKCITCLRYTRATAPLMGNLPSSRFTGVRPFLTCGVDFAGPFLCKTSPLRNARVVKSYLALFICMSSRAVHLELVDSLSTESFLNAFDRFSSRRGLPEHVLSDCGTNFIGAASYLTEVCRWFSANQTHDDIVNHTSHLNVRWSFNPPRSPHFGGSWESAIKSAKTLIYKEFGNHPYTLLELSTMFAKVEGIMNSRPLLPVSESPDDPETLTPGHFLIGQPLTALPEMDFTDVPINRLSRWELLRARIQHFWNRWKNEYLNSLQERQKWTKRQPNLKVGDIVILREPSSPPASWPIARVMELHPGKDSVVRVVTVVTAKSVFKRSVLNVIPLPVNDRSECSA